MNCLKKVPLPMVLLLYAVSGGLYGLYWLLSRSYCVYFSQKATGKKFFYFFTISIMIVYFVFLFVGSVFFEVKAVEENFRYYRTILFPFAILIYLLVTIMAVNVAKYVNNCGPKRAAAPSVVIALTFLGFTSTLYLQSRINGLEQTD